MKFICFTVVYGAGATSASCDVTPEDDLVSALQYGMKVRDMPAGTAHSHRPWKCHNYAAGQNNEWCRETSEHEGSEIRFSKGIDAKAPGCGPCWCCSKPAPSPAVLPPVFVGKVEHADWQCHAYGSGENDEWCSGSPEKNGFQMRFTAGNDALAPGCGDDCWCCKRDTRPKSPDWFGNIPMCGDQKLRPMDGGKTTVTCSGTNKFACSMEYLSEQCGSVEQACCSDEDGCADNSYIISCVQPVAPDWFGNIPMCDGQELRPMDGGKTTVTCSGTNIFKCTKKHLSKECGSVEQACCSDEDGTCADNSYSFSCVKPAAAPSPTPTPEMTKPSPKPTMTEPAPVPEPEPAPTPAFNCMTRELWTPEKKVWCCKNQGKGCKFNCMTRELWTDEKVRWCAGLHAPSPAPPPSPAVVGEHTMTKPSPAPAPPVGEHTVVTVVSVAPAWMGARPLCGNSELMQLDKGTTACAGSCSNKCEDWVRPHKEADFDWCTEWGLGLCCSDEDGDCTNDGYQFSCLKK